MGHAYTIFPEILQVPLIVHLPSAWAGLRADPSAPAFTTDLTPTLYALLGHEPRPPAAFFGRPLFRKDGAPAPPRSTDPQVVASSYGSVYGALLDDARRLYIFDGIALREYVYELDGSGAGRADGDRGRGSRARSARHSRDRRGHCAIQSLSTMSASGVQLTWRTRTDAHGRGIETEGEVRLLGTLGTSVGRP